MSFTGRLESAWSFNYVPGPNYDAAAEKLVVSYNEALSRSADQPIFLFLDILMFVIYLGIYQSYVDCAIYFTHTFVLCFQYIPFACKHGLHHLPADRPLRHQTTLFFIFAHVYYF